MTNTFKSVTLKIVKVIIIKIETRKEGVNVSIYVTTGRTTRTGAAVQELLQGQGHEVLNIDYKGDNYLANLSIVERRRGAIDEVSRRHPDGIDVPTYSAGIDPTAPPKTILALSFFVSVQLTEGLRPLLKRKHGNCVITSSNSITNIAVYPD